MVIMNGDGGNTTTAATGDDDGLPAYSHHDKIPPWWECVWSLDDDLITMMIMIMMIYI